MTPGPEPLVPALDSRGSKLPLWLARLHRSLPVDATATIAVEPDPAPEGSPPIEDLLHGGGFAVLDGGPPSTGSTEFCANTATGPDGLIEYRIRRLQSLPDWVGPDMKALMVGLNPSPASAETGINFARPGNRFWPAALAAGLVATDRDPELALLVRHIGFTDLVKHTTRTAAELTRADYEAGLARLVRLVSWLEPKTVVMVGLAGWRAAVDRRAAAGWQPGRLGSAPVYVMPNTSGLNARSSLDDFTAHFRAVGQAPPRA